MKKNNILFCLLILSLGFVVAIAPQFDSSFVKWTMCEQFNLTKWDCDIWWESTSNPYYVQPINGLNYSEIQRDFFNKTEVNNKFQNYLNESEVFKLVSGNNIENISKDFYNKSEVEIMLNELKINFSQKFATMDDIEDFDKEKDSSSGVGNELILIGVVILIAIVGFFFYTQKQKETKKTNSYLSNDAEIQKAMQLEKMKNKLNQANQSSQTVQEY